MHISRDNIQHTHKENLWRLKLIRAVVNINHIFLFQSGTTIHNKVSSKKSPFFGEEEHADEVGEEEQADEVGEEEHADEVGEEKQADEVDWIHKKNSIQGQCYVNKIRICELCLILNRTVSYCSWSHYKVIDIVHCSKKQC